MLCVREDDRWGSQVDSNYWGLEGVCVEVIAYIAAHKRTLAVDMQEVEFAEGRQIAGPVEVVADWLAQGAVEVGVAASTATQRAVEGGAVVSTWAA
jgi:hypothetical protein